MNQSCIRTSALVAALLGIVGSSTLSAAECIGITFPEEEEFANVPMVLNGMGIRKATMLNIQVYVAALYLPERSDNGASILESDEPWHLDLHFVRDVDADDARSAMQEYFEDSASDQVESFQDRIDQLNAIMPDLKNGDVLHFTSTGDGVEVGLDRMGEITIEGDDFAKVLLAIWVGENPPNPSLKEGVLGGPCD